MSSSQDPVRVIAERIARRLASHATGGQSLPASNRGAENADRPRARVVNFISSTPPARTLPTIVATSQEQSKNLDSNSSVVPQVAQSPWLAPFSRSAPHANVPPAEHPSQERFGVEEAAVSELVEFFENEKQCSVDP